MANKQTAQDYLQKAGTVSMEYLNIFKTKLTNTVVDTVYMAEGIGKQVLPGNPVTREYEITQHIGSAGPGLLWRLYAGFKKSTKQEATLFVLQKKNLEAYPKRDRDQIIEAFKRGATQLARIKHPRILSLQHQLEESKESLAFATEPCFCSVANALGNHENMPMPLPTEYTEYKLHEVEIKYGLMQIAEALSFLHKDVKILHRNICPESVIINSNGAWKLAGFELFVNNINDPNDPLAFPFKDWDGSQSVILNPSLDYLAPEYALASKCDCSSDMFSYGMLFFTCYNNGKSLYKCHASYQTFVSNAESLKKLTNNQMSGIPDEIREYLKLLLHMNPELRPDAHQVMKIPFFDDVAVKTLEYLDSSFQNDNLQKSHFFRSLPQIIDKLPKRVCLQRIIPCLELEFINPDMIPFVLPNIFLIAEQATNEEYVKYILPRLKIIFKLQKPVQILLIVLRNMSLVLSKTPATEIKEHILPMVCRALESDTIVEVQELCLSSLPSFASLLDNNSIKHQVLPRIRKLCLESSTLSVRVNSLICIGKLLENLDKWIVLDDVLPILEKINQRDSAVLMAMLGIYKIVLTHPKLGITKDILATKVIPYLIPILIDNNLNLSQFNSYMSLVRDMLSQIEVEQKKKLEQIEQMEREKSIIPYAMANSSQPKQAVGINKAPETMMDKLMIGYGINNSESNSSSVAPVNVAASTLQVANTKKQMTLDEKQTMAMELEKNEQMNRGNSNSNSMANSKSLMNFNSSTVSNKSNSSDLTDDLFSKNLSSLSSKANANNSNNGFNNFSIQSNNGWPNAAAGFQSQPQQHQNQQQQMKINFNSFINNNNNNNSNNSVTNNSNNMGFFGNLALPPPPQSKPMNQMSNSTFPMTSQNILKPMITPSQANSNPSNSKKSAFDDLADLLG